MAESVDACTLVRNKVEPIEADKTFGGSNP
jgi:hypothetical protein